MTTRLASQMDFPDEENEQRFVREFTRALASDTGEEARRHLAAGRPIYYGDDRFADGVVKEHPDGRRQLVTFRNDAEVLIKDL